MYKSKKPYLYGTGRRKSSVARVRLYEGGTGKITINGRDIDDYFGLDTLKLITRQPLVLTEHGRARLTSSLPSPAAASPARLALLRHGISRALLLVRPRIPSRSEESWLT